MAHLGSNLHSFHLTSIDSITDIVRKVIREQQVVTYFQPIVSVKNRSIIGLEALSRGTPALSSIIPPKLLFEQAALLGMTIELDRLCRDTALTAFQPITFAHPDLFLFLNFDTTIIDKGVVGSGYLHKSTEKRNLQAGNIVIEISESNIQDVDLLKKFIQMYKSYGFLFALDDIGIGSSNLDRILLTKPDILKIDRCLINGIDHDYYKQELFSSIVNIAKKVGALVVAEGVETETEAIVCCEIGADLLQGFYFAKPQPANCPILPETFTLAIDSVNKLFKQYRVDKISAKVHTHQLYKTIAHNLTDELAKTPPELFEEKLKKLAHYPNLEYVYILARNGIQISNSVCDTCAFPGSKKRLFNAAQKGTDQSLKDYYLYLHSGLTEYITDPYISYASGSLCVTVSMLFTSADQQFILCADFTV
ncbi:EAL domain-containing protein [Sporomusa malonica]|uniref:EAL domain, c-di-GMP-specific phosphodiesterase class I (Or its enzymatically inactive variant) n=1 Tax=Sporomusa malonica TaxID=112901 RepID=A0A1W2DUT4_9FIRM|nr:EAL domain-containing protein [Sporomusa malonica]SMD00806.1 EAL domain, c-di-GMP-specific phosphodiesterase class I (or its enzymatically inactive variant) [Sporomusa malonica]